MASEAAGWQRKSSKSESPIRLKISEHPIFALSLLGAYVLLAWVMVRAQEVIFLTFLSILFAFIFSYPLNLMSRVIPRSLALAITLLGFVALMTGVLGLTLPTLSKQFKGIVARVPEAADRIEDWYLHTRRTSPVAQMPQGQEVARRLRDRVTQTVEGVVSKTLPAAVGVVSGLSGLILMILMAAFLAYSPQGYLIAVRHGVSKAREPIVNECWRRVGDGLRGWMRGILISMALMGAFTAIGLRIAGIDNWFMLAVLTFFGTFIPYLGAIASAVPGLILALAQSPRHFFYALIVYIGVHFVEGYLVQPLVMKSAVEIRPAFLLFWQTLMTALFGVIGIIVATPILVCLHVLFEYLYVERVLQKS